ncbi:ATP-grasp domain-containing protein [Micromonospora sagamiensis]|uniref:Biotin carboxylase n=1 Tax=Micromonospora sagamiensis TaxID=47875 RepID=A0A562WL60_9ACTN|nr:ATP-grasp domain-containing protein [Micromonospora sagamiensis]TWJ31033.1 biotin carboxylase [Micromonospora sagamiensis]
MTTKASRPWLVLVESNTTGTGRLFASTGRALGLTPVLLAADPARYPYVAADGVECVQVDTGDAKALEVACAALAGRASIGAVLSSSEYFVLAASRLAGHLGLPAPDPDAVRRCRDKGAQRRALADQPGAVRFAECVDVDRAVEAAEQLGGDVVVKPCFGSGSEGVRACGSPAEVEAWARKLLDVRHNERGLPIEPRILVEERVTGPEYSVEMLDGTVYGITAKHVGDEPFFVEVGHDFPACLDRSDSARVAETARRAVEALGLRSGPAHVELRLAERGPVIMEVNPRLAGGMIPHLVRLATGHDMIAATILHATRRTTAPPDPRPHHHASIRFLTLPESGEIGGVTGLDRAWEVPGVVDVVCTATVGERRQRHHSFRDRVGHVLALGETAADAATAAESGRSAITVTVVDPHEVSAARPGR